MLIARQLTDRQRDHLVSYVARKANQTERFYASWRRYYQSAKQEAEKGTVASMERASMDLALAIAARRQSRRLTAR